MASLTEIVLQLHSLGGIKFGSFKLKSGKESPIYFDLRVMVQSPELMGNIAKCMWNVFEEANATTDILCGVPYTALPLATLMACQTGKPMLIMRKEKKEYGTSKRIEGLEGATGKDCLIIEDVITTGGSVMETAKELRQEGLKVSHVIVFLDRNHGGKSHLENNGIKVHEILQVQAILDILCSQGRISQDQKIAVETFVREANFTKEPSVRSMTLDQRRKLSKSDLAQRLYRIMEKKKSNLCLSVDVTSKHRLIEFANTMGPQICCLKTHMDILMDFDPKVPLTLKELAEKHDFLLFEDRKLADIGKTVEEQMRGPFQIASWADLVTVHALPGPGVLDGLNGLKCKAIVVAEMSSKGNMASKEYAQKCMAMTKSHPNANGVVAQSRLDDSDPDMLHFTPGVQMSQTSDHLGQQYNTPEVAIIERGADIIIVGRGILEDDDPLAKAKKYRQDGWNALIQRIKNGGR